VLSVTSICPLPFLAYLQHLIGNERFARYQRQSMPVTKANFSRSVGLPVQSDRENQVVDAIKMVYNL
jgi:hypothetical protein